VRPSLKQLPATLSATIYFSWKRHPCHPERSRGTCGAPFPQTTASNSFSHHYFSWKRHPPLVIPSAAEGPAVRPSPKQLPATLSATITSHGNATLPLSSRGGCSLRANSGFPSTRHSFTAMFAAFSKESRMSLTESTKSDRKSGGSRGICSSISLHAKAPESRPAAWGRWPS
jgi:hypothetical protein